MPRERLVVDDDDVFGRLTVEREPVVLALMPVFEPIGARRGEWERAREIEAEYLAPRSRS